MRRLEENVVTAVRNIWASSTWTSRAQLHQRLITFAATHSIDSTSEETIDWLIPLFVESTAVTTQSKLTYAKQLGALFRRMGNTLPVCSMYCAALRAAGALIPTRQAAPASDEHVDRMMVRARAAGLPRLEAALFLMWKTASRADEILRPTGASFLEATDAQIVIEWLDRTKATAADPFSTRAWTVVHHDMPMTSIVATLRQLPQEELLLDWTTEQLVDWFRRDPRTAHLTAHSLKRGAIHVLTTMIVGRKLDLELLPRLAKHKQPLEFVTSTTLRYIPDRITAALMLRTHEATVLIPCAPRLPESMFQPPLAEEVMQEIGRHASASPDPPLRRTSTPTTSSSSRASTPPGATTIMARVRLRRALERERQRRREERSERQRRQQRPPSL